MTPIRVRIYSSIVLIPSLIVLGILGNALGNYMLKGVLADAVAFGLGTAPQSVLLGVGLVCFLQYFSWATERAICKSREAKPEQGGEFAEL